MFETTRGNADVVSVYARSVPYPVATSFAVEVYRILTNDTDFTPFRQAGRFTGLNQAYIDGSAVYHSPGDTPSSMDQAACSSTATTRSRWPRVRRRRPRRAREAVGGDATYFPVLRQLVRYPAWLIWPFAVLASWPSPPGVPGPTAPVRHVPAGGRRFGLAFVPLLLAPCSPNCCGRCWWRSGRATRNDRSVAPGLVPLAVVALVATVLLGWYGLLRKRFGAWALTLGRCSCWRSSGWCSPPPRPAGPTWPRCRRSPGRRRAGHADAAQRVGPAARLDRRRRGGGADPRPTVLLFFPALGLATGAAAALFATMLGLALLPVFEYVYPLPSRRLWSSLPSVVAGVLTVACVGVGLAVDRFDAAHPAPTQLMYALDTDTGQARWLSAETSPAEWTSQYVTGTEDVSAQFPLFDEELATGPAQATPCPAPELSVVSDSTSRRSAPPRALGPAAAGRPAGVPAHRGRGSRCGGQCWADGRSRSPRTSRSPCCSTPRRPRG
jgi:hypothetical protein